MRVKTLLFSDIRFQFKYGFYFVYLVFSILYISLLFAFPESWKQKAAILMIFTDPAAMGLYFMGSIILFEKSERVLNSIALSPVKPSEYVFSKLVSIGIISTVVGLILGFCGQVDANPVYFTVGVFLCSCLFSSLGLMVACKTITLNQFVLATIPVEILINVPAVVWLFGMKKSGLLFHPGVCMIELCTGGENSFLSMMILFLWTALFFTLACVVVRKMFRSVGGIKL